MSTVAPLSLYRVDAPALPPSIGQGEAATGVTFTREGFAPVTIEYGTVVKASNTCDGERALANLEADPPLVRVDVLQQLLVTAL